MPLLIVFVIAFFAYASLTDLFEQNHEANEKLCNTQVTSLKIDYLRDCE